MHPGTLTTATAANLAFTLFNQCKYTEAQLLFEATLEVQLVRHRLGFIGIRGLRPMSGNLKTATACPFLGLGLAGLLLAE